MSVQFTRGARRFAVAAVAVASAVVLVSTVSSGATAAPAPLDPAPATAPETAPATAPAPVSDEEGSSLDSPSLSDLLNDADRTATAAGGGFKSSSVWRNDYAETTKLTAWVDANSALPSAAIRTVRDASVSPRRDFHGAVAVRVPGLDPASMTGWVELPQRPRSAAERRVLAVATPGAVAVVAPVPTLPLAGVAFTPAAVIAQLTRAKDVPWALVADVQHCSTTGVTCTVSREAVARGHVKWRVEMDRGLPWDPDPDVYTFRQNANGYVVHATVATSSGKLTLSASRLGSGARPQSPLARGAVTYPSVALTQASSAEEARSIAKTLSERLGDVIAEEGRPVTPKSMRWAFDKIADRSPDLGWEFSVSPRLDVRWAQGKSSSWQGDELVVKVVASDGLTQSQSELTLSVVAGKFTWTVR